MGFVAAEGTHFTSDIPASMLTLADLDNMTLDQRLRQFQRAGGTGGPNTRLHSRVYHSPETQHKLWNSMSSTTNRKEIGVYDWGSDCRVILGIAVKTGKKADHEVVLNYSNNIPNDRHS